LLENLAGNNMGKNFPLVDFVDSGVVRQIKSIGSTNLKYVRGFVRGAARDTLRFTAQNVGQAGKDAEVLALMRTGTGSDVVNAARNALGGSKALAATVRVVKGLPGVIGGAFRVLGWLGAALSAGQLADDYKRGDVASGIGNVLNVTSFGLALGAKALGAASTGAAGAAAAYGSAVFGAGALGYGIGTLINSQLSESTHDAIGGYTNQIANEGGWKELWQHPFGWGLWHVF